MTKPILKYYEVVLVIHPDYEDKINSLIESYEKLLKEDGGLIDRLEKWGKRNLAYPIKKQNKGFYILINASCQGDAITKIQNLIRFNENILRSLVVKTKNRIEKGQKSLMMESILEEREQLKEKSSHQPAKEPAKEEGAQS